VLIHSGGVSGGHYYAYIKDLDSGKWFNFNDSNVSEIEVNASVSL
jgi:ubiquitin C-terminal hydrolase